MQYEVDVSIIIISYFHERYIMKAIKSVLNQKGTYTYEILISDDASQDGTLEIVEELRLLYPQIVKVHTYDKNVGTTKNLYDAFLRARGKYITLLSGDDSYSDENKVSNQISILEQKRNVFAVAIPTRWVYTDGSTAGYVFPTKKWRGKIFRKIDYERGWDFPIHGVMFRNHFDDVDFRESFFSIAENERYVEDLTLSVLLLIKGDIYILKDIGYDFLVRKSTDINEHNYNSVIKKYDSLLLQISLLKKLQEQHKGEISLENRLGQFGWTLFRNIIKDHEYAYLSSLKGISFRAICFGAMKWLGERYDFFNQYK